MDAKKNEHRTIVERKSDRELVITRTFDAPPRIVFEAWSKPDLFKLWWVPKSAGMKLVSCEMDIRVGGKYRLVFELGGRSMAFFGTYQEVTPPSRLVWTNEEGAGESITTVTLEEKDGKTLLVLHERHPSKESLEEGLAAAEGMHETFDQLDALLITVEARSRG